MTPSESDPVQSSDAILDNPAYAALTGLQAHLAQARGRAARYVPGAARFSGLPDDAGPADWADLAALVGPDDAVVLLEPPPRPEGWLELQSFAAVQMIRAVNAVGTVRSAGAEQIPTGPRDPLELDERLSLLDLETDDVPEMVDLVARTEPGPFGPRTIELGRYVGVRDGGRLVAMAGERMHAPGWTEMSAVCTDLAYRGRGLGRQLVDVVSSGIERRGDRAFLHVEASNTAARRVYAAAGLTVRRALTIRVLRPPR